MDQFIGTKVLLAKPMTLGTYNKYRGLEIPENENPLKEGYLVEYEATEEKSNHKDHDGYISWSPKQVFEKAYRKLEHMTFGQAIEALKIGYKVARIGWNGANMFLYLVEKQSFPSLTKHAKEVFGEVTPYRSYFALKTAQNDIAMWSPSGSDALAEDWFAII